MDGGLDLRQEFLQLGLRDHLAAGGRQLREEVGVGRRPMMVAERLSWLL